MAALSDALWRAWCWTRLAVAWLNAWLGAWLRVRLRVRPVVNAHDPHTPKPYRIYAFNEGVGEGFHREISVNSLDPETWERDVADATGWHAFRLEIRYEFRHKKYRMVLRRGDACELPPYADVPVCRLPKGVLSARLQGPKGSDINADVTARVLKYQGPKGDFHAGLGLAPRLRDMFPFDDHVDNALRFSHLRVIDTTARIVDIPYASNPDMRAALQPACDASPDASA